jgi:hypothetical protein
MEVDNEFQSFEQHFANGYYLCEILYKLNGIHRNKFQQANNDDKKLSVKTNYMLIKSGLIRLKVPFVSQILQYIKHQSANICVHLLLQLKFSPMGASFDTPLSVSISDDQCCMHTNGNTFDPTCPDQYVYILYHRYEYCRHICI